MEAALLAVSLGIDALVMPAGLQNKGWLGRISMMKEVGENLHVRCPYIFKGP